IGTLSITVSTAAPGGGTSSPISLVLSGPPPPPSLTALSPTTVPIGSSSIITASGANFTSGSFVTVDNVARPTTFVSSTLLSFTGANLTAGNHSVAVVTPAPGGGASAPLTLAVVGPTLNVSESAISPGGTITVNLADGPGTDRAWL